MTLLFKIIRWSPLPAATKLGCLRILLEQAYRKDILTAQKANDRDKVASLERDLQAELNLHDEEHDTFLTKALLSKAQRLRVPVPHRYNDDNSESEYWYQGHYTGAWCLTALGVTALREEIRKELKAKHEARSHWGVWISSLTGIVGALTALIALLASRVA